MRSFFVFGAISRVFSRQKEPGNLEEKTDLVLELVKEIRDELKPLGPTGERVSRLELIMGAISQLEPGERKAVMQELEALEVDEQIVAFIEAPKTIEEIAQHISRSYGYTANRLRYLLKQGKVMRKRDAVTRKYVYVRLST